MGTMDASRYRILNKIGAGFFSDVYLAEHPESSQPIALKIWGSLKDFRESVDKKWGRPVMSLRHDNLVSVLDCGFLPEYGPYVAMEFLEGRRLSDLLAVGQITIPSALAFLVEAANGLEAMHRRKLHHGSIRPTKIWITGRLHGDGPYRGAERPAAKLLDILRHPPNFRAGSGPDLPVFHPLLPAYASPESIRGKGSDRRSEDLFALGVILYEIICGALPWSFQGLSTMHSLVHRLTVEPFPPPEMAAKHGRACPPMLDALISKALRKEPKQRHQSASEFAQSLRTAVDAYFSAPDRR